MDKKKINLHFSLPSKRKDVNGRKYRKKERQKIGGGQVGECVGRGKRRALFSGSMTCKLFHETNLPEGLLKMLTNTEVC